jgi:peptide/nickel transport system substrate-binding protein
VGSRRARTLLVALGATLLLLGVPAGSAPATTTSSGGTLSVIDPMDIVSLDPALNMGDFAWALEDGTCATLMIFRDAPAPEGDTVQPEAAAGPPEISRDGRTYVFTVRRGLRFSDGSPLTAGNFKRALGRVLDPAMRSPGAYLFSDVRRVSATGLRLRITLSKPSGDLTTRLALPLACPVPLGFPVDPAGEPLVGVGSGPYYVASHVADSLLVVKRNRYYRGSRSHRVDGLTVTVGGDVDSDIKAVEDGRADMLMGPIPSALRPILAARYGVDKSQFFRIPGRAGTGALVLNTSRPLFRGNAALRKAVNFALDRAEIVRQTTSGVLSNTPTDQILPRWIPGWRDYSLYPLTGPDLPQARQLAQGHLRGGKAVLYTTPEWVDVAPVIVSNLLKIGLDVQVNVMSASVLNAKAGIPGEPYDMILGDQLLDYPDPANMIVRYLDGENARKPAGNTNLAYFDEPAYNHRIAAADRLTGTARFQAFSRLDADIMRNEAPWAPLLEESKWLFISNRVGCLQLHPVFRFDLATVCLRSG